MSQRWIKVLVVLLLSLLILSIVEEHVNLSRYISLPYIDTVTPVSILVSSSLSSTSSSQTAFYLDSQCTKQIAEGSTSNNDQSPDTKNETKDSRLCRALGLDRGWSASALWQTHLDDILQASMHPSDPSHVHRFWIKELLHVVPPRLLERTIVTRLGREPMKEIVQIIQQRRRHLNDPLSSTSSSPPPPPLLVAVYGGSVAEGSGCNKLPVELGPLPVLSNLRGKTCAWPMRLQLLADRFLGPNVVLIENVAVGGTNSLLALPTLQYRLYPKHSLLQTRGPDIIINAYSVNDNLPDHTIAANSTQNRLHFRMALGKTQSFMSTALQSRPCRTPPALVYVNEYLGNQNELLLGEDIRHQVVAAVSDYFGTNTAYVSLPAAVKEFVYTNERETIFSPNWWNDRQKRITDGHFGMPGHQLLAFAMAFAALRALTEYCVEDDDNEYVKSLDPAIVKQPATYCPVPLLHDKLTFAAKHDQSLHEQCQREEAAYCAHADVTAAPCPFAFVATPAGTTRNAQELNAYLLPFLSNTDSTGWRGENDIRNGWQNKLGLVAHNVNATLNIHLPNISNRVRIVTVHYLKSYGEQWRNSTARFDINIIRNAHHDNQTAVKENYDVSFYLYAEHDMNFSLAYPFELDLKDKAADKGDTVNVQVTLLFGLEFKIISLLLCNR